MFLIQLSLVDSAEKALKTRTVIRFFEARILAMLKLHGQLICSLRNNLFRY